MPKKVLTESKNIDSDGNTFYEQNYSPELIIHSDIKIKIKKDINFFLWVNLWYSTWEMIKKNYDKKTNTEISSKSVKDLYHYGSVGNNEGSLSSGENDFSDMQSNTVQNQKNNLKNEDDHFEKLGKNSNNSLYDIIYKLKHNTDLNELINIINTNLNLGIDRENLKIKLNSFEFDKFHEIKDFSNLEMTIYYSLSEK